MLNRIFLMLATLCLIAASPAVAQSYPKLMTNGNGLALTRLAVQQMSGGQVCLLPNMALTPIRPTS